jgi:tetratricopeptide (TPR) repeat protein
LPLRPANFSIGKGRFVLFSIFISGFSGKIMAGISDLTDLLKALPETLKLIPAEGRIAALSVIVLLVVLMAILRLDILKIVSRQVRERILMFIVRYICALTGAIIAISFSYAVFAKRLEASELSAGFNKQVSSRTSIPGSTQAAPPATDSLVNSLLILKSQLNPPPGIDDALAQLKSGNTKPAIDVLTNSVLATQKNNAARAETLRHIGLLEFYRDTRASLAAYQQSVELDPGSWEAWSQIANLLQRTGESAGATSAAQKVVQIGTENHDSNALGAGYAALGYIEASHGRKDQAKPLLDKARGNFLAAESYLQYAAATNNLASVEFSEGNFEDAIRDYGEALAKDTQINNPRGIAADYAGLGQVYLGQENFDKALEYFEKSVSANAGVGDPHQAALVLSGECSVYIARNGTGDLDKAKDACTGALKLERQIENRSPEVFILGRLAEIARASQDPDAALKTYGEAIKIAKTFNLDFLEGSMQRGMGVVYFEQNKPVPALDSFRRAAEIDMRLNRQNWLAYDQYWIGKTYTALGQKADACAPLKQAAEIFKRNGTADEQEDAAEAQADANCT